MEYECHKRDGDQDNNNDNNSVYELLTLQS